MTASPTPPAAVAELGAAGVGARLRPPLPAVTALGGALLAGLGAALVGWAPRGVVLVTLLPVQAVLVLAWLTLLRVPARAAGAGIALAAGVAGDVLLVAEHRPSPGGLAGVIGLGVVAAVLGQLLRRDRSRVTDVLAAQCTATLLVVAVSSPLAITAYRHGNRAAAAGLLGLGLGLLTGALRGPAARVAAVGGLLTAAAAAGVGAALLGASGAAVAATAAVATVGAVAVVAEAAGRRPVARGLAVTLPYSFAGPCAYLVARVMLG